MIILMLWLNKTSYSSKMYALSKYAGFLPSMLSGQINFFLSISVLYIWCSFNTRHITLSYRYSFSHELGVYLTSGSLYFRYKTSTSLDLQDFFQENFFVECPLLHPSKSPSFFLLSLCYKSFPQNASECQVVGQKWTVHGT